MDLDRPALQKLINELYRQENIVIFKMEYRIRIMQHYICINYKILSHKMPLKSSAITIVNSLNQAKVDAKLHVFLIKTI